MSAHNHDDETIKTNFPVDRKKVVEAIKRKKRVTEKEKREQKYNSEKRRVLEFIDTFGQFMDAEKELIFEINVNVMGVDGTAEGWGGYHYEPTDYIETSVEIFRMTKNFFTQQTSNDHAKSNQIPNG